MSGEAQATVHDDIASRPGRDSIASSLIKWTFVLLSLVFLAALLFAPLVTVFAMAFEKGIHAYVHALVDPDTASAIHLTLVTAAVVVPINTIFGLSAAWAIAKFEFPGKIGRTHV